MARVGTYDTGNIQLRISGTLTTAPPSPPLPPPSPPVAPALGKLDNPYPIDGFPHLTDTRVYVRVGRRFAGLPWQQGGAWKGRQEGRVLLRLEAWLNVEPKAHQPSIRVAHTSDRSGEVGNKPYLLRPVCSSQTPLPSRPSTVEWSPPPRLAGRTGRPLPAKLRWFPPSDAYHSMMPRLCLVGLLLAHLSLDLCPAPLALRPLQVEGHGQWHHQVSREGQANAGGIPMIPVNYQPASLATPFRRSALVAAPLSATTHPPTHVRASGQGRNPTLS